MAIIDDLIAYWPLDEASGDALDVHGTNTLTETSGTIASVAGVVGNARDFEEGDTEYFAIADNAPLSIGDITFSVNLWLQLESEANFPVAVSKGFRSDSDVNQEWAIIKFAAAAVPGPLAFIVAFGAATAATFWGANLALSTWVMVSCGHNAATDEIWIAVNAGTPVTVAHASGVNDGNRPFTLGAADAAILNWDGPVDEVAFWKRDIRADLTWLYNAGAGRSYVEIANIGHRRLANGGLLTGKLVD